MAAASRVGAVAVRKKRFSALAKAIADVTQ
jgi:hypothetical protein